MAISFAREGAVVMVVDVRAEAAEEARRLIAAEGGVCIAHVADTSDPDAASRFVERCQSELGPINATSMSRPNAKVSIKPLVAAYKPGAPSREWTEDMLTIAPPLPPCLSTCAGWFRARKEIG